MRVYASVCTVALLLGASSVPLAQGQTTLYVDADAPGPIHNGSSWEYAFRNPQDALTVATGGAEIRVAQGVYMPDGAYTPVGGVHVFGSGDRTATFQLISDVGMYGGYAGYGEADPDQRDIEAYESILTGDLSGDDGPGFTNNAENSYHVVTGSGTDASAILDGFIIRAGKADGAYTNRVGGGIYNSSGSPTVNNCTFNGNRALFRGGGMHNDTHSSPTIANCAFSGNTADEDGGGMNNYDNSNPTVIDCVFSANSANVGGAISNGWFSAPFLYRCTFVGNHAVLAGGGMYSGYHSYPTVVLCSFFRNSSYSSGGGVYSDFPSEGSLFVGCTFWGNSAWGEGGGVAARSESLHLTNCMFSANSAQTGGGIFLHSGAATVTNCSFAGNAAPDGRAVACGDRSEWAGSIVVIANSILWDGGNEIWKDEHSIATVTYSDVQGGYLGNGNIDADPLFADPDGPDDLPGTEDDDLRLRIGSPCTDAGDNTAVPQDASDLDDDGDTSERAPLDLDGHARFVDDPCFSDSGVSDPPEYVRIVDMGAFELSPDRNENGIPDESEPDSDGDGVPDPCENCPFDPDKFEPGICGCGRDDNGDSDGDGVPDCHDRCLGVDDALFAPKCVDAIPTVSTWGLVVLVLLLLVGEKIHFSRRTA